MKTTLSTNKQIFNVKKIAEAGLKPEAIEDYSMGIVDESTGLTVSPNTFDELPKKFRLIQKYRGKTYFSFDTINKSDIVWATAKDYQKEKLNKWEGVVKHCNCLKTVKLNISIKDQLLNIAMGIPYGTTDFYVEVSPAEFQCYCSCEETGAYANNVMTMLIYKQMLLQNSPFYTVKVAKESGEEFANLEAVIKFIQENKEVNTDKEKGNDGELLKFIIEAKPTSPLIKRFNPYNLDYVYPRGTHLLPSFVVNDGVYVEFKEVQPVEYEIGAGIDLVYEEYMNKSNFTNVGDYARNKHLVEFPELQFDEFKKYDTVTFEFDSLKSKRAGEADKKRFMVVLGSDVDDKSEVYNKLKEIFKLD